MKVSLKRPCRDRIIIQAYIQRYEIISRVQYRDQRLLE